MGPVGFGCKVMYGMMNGSCCQAIFRVDELSDCHFLPPVKPLWAVYGVLSVKVFYVPACIQTVMPWGIFAAW